MAMDWEIVHIPDNLPSDHLSTVDVFASAVEPKMANTLVRKLNQVAPLENLHHVKRVRKISSEGKAQLSVILCLSVGHSSQLDLDGIPNEVLELINSYQLHPFITKVAKYAASSKEEWQEQCKLWPTSYHPPTYNIDGITGFSEKDSKLIFKFVEVAIRLTKCGQLHDKVVNAAVIVDPSTKQVIAQARDETCFWPTPENKCSLKNTDFTDEAEGFPSHNLVTSEAPNNVSPDSNFTNNDWTHSYTNISCLHPWGWKEQQPMLQDSLGKCRNNFSWHPLRHAALVAIECASSRDRRLFPSSELLNGQSDHTDHLQSPAKRHKTELLMEDDTVSESSSNGFPSEVMRPYLCTGFDMFLVWEPCMMCAMALVHQRIRRIFYAFPNPNAGALGGIHRLQGEKSLNHHYAVFRVLLPEEVLDKV